MSGDHGGSGSRAAGGGAKVAFAGHQGRHLVAGRRIRNSLFFDVYVFFLGVWFGLFVFWGDVF